MVNISTLLEKSWGKRGREPEERIGSEKGRVSAMGAGVQVTTLQCLEVGTVVPSFADMEIKDQRG